MRRFGATGYDLAMGNTGEQRTKPVILVRPRAGGNTAELCVSGDFDRPQVARFDAAAAAFDTALARLTVDLTRTTLIDSAALGSLVRLRRSLDRHGGEMEVLVARPFQVTVMRVGGLYDYLGVREVGSTVEDEVDPTLRSVRPISEADQ